MKSQVTILILCCVSVIASALIPGKDFIAHGQSLPADAPVNAVDGASLFAANCSACHGSDGRGGERAPNIATRREVVSHSDVELTRIVEKGLPGNGMPGFDYLGRTKIDALIHYLRTLQGIGTAVTAPGDTRAGETLFFGKAECSSCHMMNGRGGFIAADLSGYSPGRSIADLRTAILDPDRRLGRAAQYVTIVTIESKRYTGFIRNEDNFSLVLQAQDGIFRQFARDKVARVELSGHSSMPHDYENRLSNKELDDLISYLLKAGTTEKKVTNDDE